MERRTQAVELLTGVDAEIAGRIVEQQLRNGEVDPDTHDPSEIIARIVPPRSIHTAMHATGNGLVATQLEAMPGAADAANRILYAIWEFAFAARRNVRDLAVRDARFVPALGDDPDRFVVTVDSLSQHGVDVEALPAVSPESIWPYIVARNDQLANVYEFTAGAREMVVSVIAAVQQRADRSGWPVNQIGMRNGYRRQTATGAAIRFDFYRAAPKR